jgi:hypothetical protein
MLNATLIPFPLPLTPILPTIEGNVDYREFRDQLLRISHLLIQSGLETQFLEADLKRWLADHPKVNAKAQQNHQLHSQRALRCNIARSLLAEDCGRGISPKWPISKCAARWLFTEISASSRRFRHETRRSELDQSRA